MTLVRTNLPIGKTINSLMEEFVKEFPTNWKNDYAGYGFPKVNIHETTDGYHLEMNAPGRNKEDFKILNENGVLTISYEQKEESKSEDYKTIRREFTYRSFKRSFNLDETIDASNIQAKYENGVLKLYLPKKEVVKESAKQITIQ